MEHAHCTDIRDMLDLVGVRLGELQTYEGRKQSSAYRHFSKKLYFRPGWDDSKVEDQVTHNFTVCKQVYHEMVRLLNKLITLSICIVGHSREGRYNTQESQATKPFNIF